MRMIFAALLVAGVAAGAAPQALAAAPNDIIWDPPKPAASTPSKETLTPLVPPAPSAQNSSPQGVPDKNGVIWDAPPSAGAAAPPALPTPSAKPDGNGIVWNAPPVKPFSAPPAGALLTPPSGAPPRGRLAQAPAAPLTDGPCREFQTTIVIDGRREPAHGTVCQQPDGTWRVVNK